MQLNKLKSGIKYDNGVALKLSPNSHKLLLTNTQVSRLLTAFANNPSANIKLPKPQLHEIGKPGGFLCRVLGQFLKTAFTKRFHLIGNVPKPLAKSILIPIGLTAAGSATDTANHKKMFGSRPDYIKPFE